MLFYDNYIRLCASISKTPGAVAKEIGIERSNVTHWKYGRNKPSDITIAKIADYFGVDPSALTEGKQKAPTVSGERRNIIKIVGRDGSVIVKELTDEQLSAYKTMVDHLPEADDL